MNRKVEDSEPELWHLRESGGVEQNANNVLFIDRLRDQRGAVIPDQGGGELPVRAMRLKKNRNGPTDWFQTRWMRECTLFLPYTGRRDEPAVNWRRSEPVEPTPATVKDATEKLLDRLLAPQSAEELDSRSAKERTAEVLGGAA